MPGRSAAMISAHSTGSAVTARWPTSASTGRRASKVSGRAWAGASHRAVTADPGEWAEIIAAERPGILISCLGTTIRQAGSQDAFRAVDHDLLLACARAAKAAGTAHMIAVSSVGAAAHSANFYLRTKGEVEEELRAMSRPGRIRSSRRKFSARSASSTSPFVRR